MIQKQGFGIWRYPQQEGSLWLGSLEFWDGYPVPRGLDAEDGITLLEFVADSPTVWLPTAKSFVPIDRMNPDHVTLLMSTLPCIGYQAVPFDSDAISKAWDPAKHPRGQPENKGEFTSTGPAAGPDVRREFESAVKQAGKYHFDTPKLNVMAAMLHSRRADALPETVAESEIQNRVAGGEVELWRGVQEKRYGTTFRGGPLHIGTGILGSGVYAALGAEARQYALDYTGGGAGDLIHMTVKSEAKVGDWATVVHDMGEESKRLGANRRMDEFSKMFLDVGVYATAKGYDALLSPKLGMGLILNRNMLRVSKENGVKAAVAKSAPVVANADLSRRVGAAMDSDRLTSLVGEPDNYMKFVEAVLASKRFADLPNWVQEEVLEGEAELGV